MTRMQEEMRSLAGMAGEHAGCRGKHAAWIDIKRAVSCIRSWQRPDGSLDLDAARSRTAGELVETIVASVAALTASMPYDAAYHDALASDLHRWREEGFGVPDFLDSLLAFRPAGERVDGREHLVVFPMYTQNGNPDRNLEAVLFRMVWPDWLAELEAQRFDNPLFCSIAFCDFTAGYDTFSAVLFPETVAVRQAPERFSWGAIFCDREAARFRKVSRAAIDLLGVELPEEIASLLDDHGRCQDAFVLWDLVHDRTHSRGDLPFDPFMIKQRQPYWMYGLEELRCDLTAFRAAVELEAEGIVQARDVQHAILFDRLFRFPVTGERNRNYDGLGGQLLFAYLHRHDALRWTDNALRFDFDRIADVTAALCGEIEQLYRDGIDRPKLVHWLAGYDLVRTYLSPHPASRWADAATRLDLTQAPRDLVGEVLPDEFPLSMFYEALSRKLRAVIEGTRGIVAAA